MGYITLQDPSGLSYDFKIAGDTPSPTEQARIQSILAGQNVQQPQAPAQPNSFGQAVKGGIGSLVTSTEGGVARIGQGIAENNGGSFLGVPATDFQQYAEQKDKENEEYQKLIPDFFGSNESVGQRLSSLAGTAIQSAPPIIGGVLGAPFGPAGVALGAGVGAALMVPQQLQQNVQEQQQANEKAGDPNKPIDWRKAGAATAAQSVVEYASDLIPFHAAGFLTKDVLGKAVNGTVKTLAKTGIAASKTALAEGTEEAVQQALQRWQAGENLGDKEALTSYMQNAILGGIIGGGIGGAVGFAGARHDAKTIRAMTDAEKDAKDEADRLAQANATNVPAAEARRAAPYQETPEPLDPNVKPFGLLTDRSNEQTAVQTALNNEQNATPANAPAMEKAETQPFTESEYVGAMDMFRGKGMISPDRIKREYKVGTPKATAIFQEMLRRNDATPAGSLGQYATITTPRGIATRTGSNITGEVTPGLKRDYIVRPVDQADIQPYSLTVNGKKIKKKFQTQDEADSFAQSNNLTNYTVQRDQVPQQYGIYQMHYRNLPGGAEQLVGKQVVDTFPTIEEANEGVKRYDPAYSPQTNIKRPVLSEEEKQTKIKEDFKKEVGPTAKALQDLTEQVFGPGRVQSRLVPNIAHPVEGTIAEGVTYPTPRGEDGRLKTGLQQIFAVSNDLFNGNPEAIKGVATHEFMHVARELDLLKPKEWDLLEKTALNKKVPGKTYTFAQLGLARNSKDDVDANGDPVKIVTTPHLSEESMAEMFRYHAENPTALDKPVRSILDKLIDFLRRIVGLKKRYTGEDLMRAILNGELANRPEGYGGLGPRKYAGSPQFSKVIVPPMYMKSDRFIQTAKQERAKPEQWKKIFQDSPIKKEELEWLGLNEWLDRQEGQVNKGDIADFIRANALQPEEFKGTTYPVDRHSPYQDYLVNRWAETDDPNFDTWMTEKRYPPELEPAVEAHIAYLAKRREELRSYRPTFHKGTTQPGGDDYREFAFSLPGLQPQFRVEGHLGGMPNVLVFARTKVRTFGGKKYLFIEEMQSDLHQRGAKGGYARKVPPEEFDRLTDQALEITNKIIDTRRARQALVAKVRQENRDFTAAEDRDFETLSDHIRHLDNLLDQIDNQRYGGPEGMPPDAPLKSNWQEYAFKRLLRHAVEQGYDGIAWHGEPESVAATEHWPDFQETTNEKGNKVYTAYGEPVTGAVNTYLTRLPATVQKYVKQWGLTPKHINAGSQNLSLAELVKTKEDFYSLASQIAMESMNSPLFKSMYKLGQIVQNQRQYDIEDAISRAKVDPAPIIKFIKDFERQNGERADENGNPLFDRYQLDFNDQIRDSVLYEGQPIWSAVSPARMEQIKENPNFQKWFEGSIVVQPNGDPMVVYHGTRADVDYDRFRSLSHFGTLAAAGDRLSFTAMDDAIGRHFDKEYAVKGPGATTPLMDNIAKKYGVWDDGLSVAANRKRADEWFHGLPPEEKMQIVFAVDPDMAEKMRIYPVFLSIKKPILVTDDGSLDGWMDLALSAELNGYITPKDRYYFTNTLGDGRAFINFLKKKGYDGFIYRNTVEDAGSTSYIPFDPEQIKSVYNRGTWNPKEPRMDYSAVSVRTDTPEFNKWFAGSKIVGPSGRPLLMYHGTNANFDAFDPAKLNSKTDHGWYGSGFYFTPSADVASKYSGRLKAVDVPYSWGDIDKNFPPDAADGSNPFGRTRMHDYTGGNVMPVYLAVKNPYIWPHSKQAFIEEKSSKKFSETLKNLGYDGIIVPSFGDAGFSEVIVFNKNQIKSAYNKGTWNPDDDRVNYSSVTVPKEFYSTTAPMGQRVPASAPADKLSEVTAKITYNNAAPVLQKLNVLLPDSMKYKFEKGVEDTFIAMQDRMLTWGKLIDRMRANGGFITNENDPYFREQLFSGQTDDALQRAESGVYKPLMTKIKSLNVTRKDAEEAAKINDAAKSIITQYLPKHHMALTELYLYAQHAQERNALMRQRNAEAVGFRPEQYEHGSGMSDKEAQDILAWFQSKSFGKSFHDETDPNSVRSLFRKLIAHTNDIRVEGQLTPEFRGTSADFYKDYAPLRNWLDEHMDADEDAVQFAKAGKGYNVRGNEDPAALGRQRLASNIIGNAILQNEEAIVRAGKNKVGLSVLQLIRDNPELMNGFAESIDSRPTKWALDRKKGIVRRVPDNSVRTDPNVLTVKERVPGENRIKETYIRFKDDRLARALTTKSSLGNAGVGPVAKFLLQLNHILGSLATSWNPEFMVANFIRDLQTAAINLSEHDMKGLKAELIRNVLPALKGVYDAQRTGKFDSEWAKTFSEFRKNGGMTAYMGLRDLANTIERINKSLQEDPSGGNVKKVLKPIRGFFEYVDLWNAAVENGTRLAAYKALRDRYLAMTNDPTDPKNIKRAQEQAAFAAKNLTVNFNMGGTTKPVLNALYLFYNASMQGSMALLNPMIRSKKLKKIWVGLIVAGLLQDVIMSALSPTDDDGLKAYDKIPDYILEHNIVFLDPFGISKRGYFKLPMPYLMNGIYNAGRMTGKALRGGTSVGNALYSVMGTMLDSLNPFGSGGNAFLNFVAPTIMDPLVDVYTNTDFTGRHIAPEENIYGGGDKASQRYWNNTNPAYVTIADWLSRISGGEGKYIPGHLEYSPNVIEYWAHFVGGGATTTAQRVYDAFATPSLGGQGTIYNMVSGQDFSMNDVPFMRRFLGNVSERTNTELYMKKRDEVENVLKELKDAAKNGDRDRYLSVMQTYPDEYRAAVQIQGIEKARKTLGRKMNQIRQSKLPDDQKDALIKSLKDQQDKLIGKGNFMMRAIQ